MLIDFRCKLQLQFLNESQLKIFSFYCAMFETIDSIDPTIRSSKLSGEILFHAD